MKTWSHRQSTVLQILASGPKSRQELVPLAGYPISSICSVIGNLEQRGVIEVALGEWDVVTWPDGSITRRERFQIRRTA